MSEIDGERALAEAFAEALGEDCEWKGCFQPPKTRGYCGKHYHAARTAGYFGGKDCAVWPCARVGVSRGYCSAHYQEARREGTLPAAEDNEHKQCPGDGEGDVCWGVVKARGLCNTHYVKWYRNKKKEGVA